MAAAGTADEAVTEWVLSKETELRLEVPSEQTLTLKLLEGSAELFGAELVRGREYKLRGVKVALFTWLGCKASTCGKDCEVYQSADTNMADVVQMHAELERLREHALATGQPGPRVMVVGPVDSGKSSVLRILTAYSLRRGRLPIAVDLDVGQSDLLLPGTICAAQLDRTTLDVERGITATAPLAYYYGHESPSADPGLFRHLCDQLAARVEERMRLHAEVQASGLFINTCGWVDGTGMELLLHAIRSLRADVAIVIGQDRLRAALQRDVGDGLRVLKLTRSDGVVQRSRVFRRHCRSNRISDYFYGPLPAPTAPVSLSPAVQVVPFSALSLVRLTTEAVSTELLPIGVEAALTGLRVVDVPPSRELLHSMVALSYASSKEEAADANVRGFMHITGVDLENKRYTMLAPCPGEITARFAVVGTVKWLETDT